MNNYWIFIVINSQWSLNKLYKIYCEYVSSIDSIILKILLIPIITVIVVLPSFYITLGITLGIYSLINFVKKNIAYQNALFSFKEDNFYVFMRNQNFLNTGTYFEKNINGRQVLINNTYNNISIKVFYRSKSNKSIKSNSSFVFSSDSVFCEFKLSNSDEYTTILDQINEINIILDNENL